MRPSAPSSPAQLAAIALAWLSAMPPDLASAADRNVPQGGYYTGPGREVWQAKGAEPEVILQQVEPEVLAIEPAFATARAGNDFTYHIPAPPGDYHLRIGYVEVLYIHPNVRVFSLLLNGKQVVTNYDLPVAMGISIERYDTDGDGRLSTSERHALPQHHIQELDVHSDADAIDLRFLASIELFERVYVSWIEVVGPGVHYFIDCGGDTDLPGQFESDPVGQAVIARLGSRAFFDLRAPFGEFAESPLGKFSEARSADADVVLKPFSCLIGFQTDDGVRWALPFFRNFGEESQPFEKVRETRTLTSIRYDVEMRGVEGTIILRSPFHPGDRKLSSAPYIDIEFSARRVRDDAPRTVRALMFLPVIERRERPIDPAQQILTGAAAITQVGGRNLERGLFALTKDAKRLNGRLFHRRRGIWATLDMPLERGAATTNLVYAAYVPDPVLTVGGKEHRFQYTRTFPSLEDVAVYALRNRDAAIAASQVIDGLVLDAIIPDSLKELTTYAFPSFLINTFLTVDDQGHEWYSSMEGFCRYHSTVDVEYNAAPFYFWFAPDLLRHQLDTWPKHLRQDAIPRADGTTENHWFVGHDVGLDDVVNGPEYPHDMPVEENTNYLLLLHQYWTWIGETAFVVGQAPTVLKLVDYLIAADIDGDGFPEHGAANTIDDAPAAVQFSREQTYLGVKTAAALIAASEILDAEGSDALRRRATVCREQAARIRATLDREGWIDDHYAVCLDRTTAGIKSPWDNLPEHTAVPRETIRPLADGEMPGWNHAHPYTSLGLLYLLRSGIEIPIDRQRLLTDLRTAAARCARRFADGHTETEPNGWVSLDMFRDAVQCYLGDDVLERSERYNALQRYRARSPGTKDRAGFCDSLYNRYLSYYPRGTAVFALIDAAAGVTLDRRAKRLTFRPVRAPVKVPLPYLADWSTLRVPWFEATRENGTTVTYQLTEPDLLAGFEVVIDLRLVGGELTTLNQGRSR